MNSKSIGCLCCLVFLGPPAPTFKPPPPTSSPLPALGLSSLLSQRHMALQHAAHAIITSHIPWNTSSTLLPPVLPRSQIRPPTPPPPKPSLAAPTFSHTLCSPPLPPTEPAAYLYTSKGSRTQRAAGNQSFSSSPVCHSDRLPGTLDRFAPSHLRHPRPRREESIRHSDIDAERRRRDPPPRP